MDANEVKQKTNSDTNVKSQAPENLSDKLKKNSLQYNQKQDLLGQLINKYNNEYNNKVQKMMNMYNK